MIPPDNFNTLIRDIMARVGGNPDEGTKNCSSTGDKTSAPKKPAITPSQALVITGILGGVLDVDSVLIDKAQTVQIVLVGSLKKKTELDKMLEQIGSMPFDTVMKAMLDNYS